MPEPVDLVVPNVTEFNVRNPTVGLEPVLTSGIVQFGEHKADYAVFWSFRPRVLVLPAGYDRLWFDDVHSALRLDPPPVVSPAKRTGLVARDLLRDGPGQARLRELLAGRPVRLVSWGATPEIYLIASLLRGWGLTVELDGAEEDAYWASLYLDSKLSCLELAGQLPQVRVPPGLTVASPTELRGALRRLLARHRQVVVRSMYGVGGDGSVVVGVGDQRAFWDTLQQDPFLRVFPLTVQQFVEHAPGIGCPAVDLRVADGGLREVTLTAMNVDVVRVSGVTVGPGSLGPPYAGQVLEVAEQVGAVAHELGFRGWLCVDCLVGTDGVLYLTEINARRSGAMAAISLLGRMPAGHTAASHDAIPVPTRRPVSYRHHLRPAFQRLWEAGLPAYPTSVRGLRFRQPVFAAMAVAGTAAEADRVVGGMAEEVSRALGPAAAPGRARP